MSRKITSRPGPADLANDLKQEFRLYFRFGRMKLTRLFRLYPEQCFALMVFLILISVSIQLFIL